MLDRLFGLFAKTVMLTATFLLVEVLYLSLRGGIHLISYHFALTIWLTVLAAGLYVSTKFRFGKQAANWFGDTSVKMFVWLVELVFAVSFVGLGAGLIIGTLYAIIRYPLIVIALAAVSAAIILLMLYQKQRQT